MKYRNIIVGLLIPFIIYIPIFILKDKSYLPIQDFLDSEYGWLKVFKDKNLLINLDGNIKINNFFGGLERKYIQSEFDIKRIFFLIFPKYWGFIYLSIFSRVIGFLGMFLLIKDYYTKIYNRVLISISYSLIPAFTLYGISLLGLPLVYWSILNLFKKQKINYNYIILFLFPFCSHIAMIGPFLILYFLLLIFIKYKSINKNVIVGFIILVISFIVANFNLIKVFSFEETNRNMRLVLNTFPTTKGYIYSIFKIIFFGNIHPANFISILILFILLLFIIKNKINNKINLFIILILVNTFFYINQPFIVNKFSKYFISLKSFDISRIIIFNTFIFYLLLLEILYLSNKKYTLIIFFQIILNILSIPEISYNLFYKINNKIVLMNIIDIDKLFYSIDRKFFANKKNEPYKIKNFISFKCFESESLMYNVAHYINKNKEDYKIVNIGIPPSISQINGFYTLDGDFDILPSKYFKQFRKIIVEEIGKNREIRNRYDYSGNQLFIYNSELSKYDYTNCYKELNIQISKLDINIEELKKLKCNYILSAVKINNYNNSIKFLNVFNDKISCYRIFLYEII